MAVSMEQLRKFNQELGLEFEEMNFQSGPSLAVTVPTQTPGGRQDLTVLVRSYEDGEMFEATMAGGFVSTELHQKSEYKTQFLFYLLHKAWNTKFGTPEVDKDGEVRLLVEIPLADALMTLKQYHRILQVISQTAVEIAIEGSQILEHGEIKSAGDAGTQNQLQELMVAMIGMMDSSAGREKLKQIAGDDDAPEELRKLAKKLLNAVSQTPDAL